MCSQQNGNNDSRVSRGVGIRRQASLKDMDVADNLRREKIKGSTAKERVKSK